MTSSGTRDRWSPVALPADPEASRLIQAWLADRAQSLELTYADLRGADLSGGDLYDAWLTGADLRGVVLHGTSLGGAHLESAQLQRADLSDCTMVEAVLNDADLRQARFDRAELRQTKIFGCDARQASFRSCTMISTLVGDIDARGADFSDASISKGRLRLQLDESTTVTGMHGEFAGAFLLHDGSDRHELANDELQEWLRAHGADVEVLHPQRELNPPIPWSIRPDT